MNISSKDRGILRELAKKTVELSNSERNLALYRDWLEYGSSKTPARPMIRIELGTFAHEVLPDLMQCEGAEAREIEKKMLSPIANFTLFEDDTLVPAYYPIFDRKSFQPFGLTVRRTKTSGVGHHFIPYLHDLEEDWHVLQASQFSADTESADREADEMRELFGDILPVKRISNCMYCCPMQDIIHIMNMDDLYIAMADDEERFHALMRRLMDDYTAYFKMLERDKRIRSAARMQHLNQGSYCFTDELPDDIEGAPLEKLWLYMDSQETAGISPAMYRDLVFPYYKELMSRFGLVSYGCCEAVHAIWDDCLSKVDNLRKVSISPWCDESIMGERLRGTGITYLRKPPATLLGMNSALDESAVTACAKKTVQAAKGCKLEIAQRDVYQIGKDISKVKRYVELFRRES